MMKMSLAAGRCGNDRSNLRIKRYKSVPMCWEWTGCDNFSVSFLHMQAYIDHSDWKSASTYAAMRFSQALQHWACHL